MIAKRARRGRHARFILEKHPTDQRNDRDPGNRTSRDRAILESASGRTGYVLARSSPHVRRSSASL
jgi:hypothetical protein